MQLHDLVSDFAKNDAYPDEKVYLEEFGYEASLFSLWHLATNGKVRFFCGLHAVRKTNRPLFAQHHLELASEAFVRSESLRKVPNRAGVYPLLRQLQPGQRVLLSLLMFDPRVKWAASVMRIKEGDARKRLKTAMKKLHLKRPMERVRNLFRTP